MTVNLDVAAEALASLLSTVFPADMPDDDWPDYLQLQGEPTEIDFFGARAILLRVADPDGNPLIVAVLADDENAPQPWRLAVTDAGERIGEEAAGQ
jgi:hypothetical protein